MPNNLAEYGQQAVILAILTYLFAEVKGLKGRVRKLEGLEVMVERFYNWYEIVLERLHSACEFFRAGERPTDTQLAQWERTPSVEELMNPQKRAKKDENPPESSGNAPAESE